MSNLGNIHRYGNELNLGIEYVITLDNFPLYAEIICLLSGFKKNPEISMSSCPCLTHEKYNVTILIMVDNNPCLVSHCF